MVLTYHRLNDKTKQIRLLTLLPVSREVGIVHCTLETRSLNDLSKNYLDFLASRSTPTSAKKSTLSKWIQERTPSQWAELAPLRRVNRSRPSAYLHRFTWGDFAALSYVWGDESDTSMIVVNGERVVVTSSLAIALRRFSNECEFENGFKLWVDAICINQEDLEERAHQIQRMPEIYGSAWAVMAWLGEEHGRSNSAIQLIRDLAVFSEAQSPEELEQHLRMEPHLLGKGCWLALEEFMNRPYWYRLWIIQEMIMGASATWIRCGSASIDWKFFCKGIAMLKEHLWLVKDGLLYQEVEESRLKRMSAWSTTSVHLVHQDLSLLSEREENGGDWPSFGRLLDIANSADCKDPRDKVYGLVGLMSPPVQALLTPDYTIELTKIYSSAAMTFIYVYNNLEPLREGNPWGPTDTPSWAADWQWEGRVRFSRAENRSLLPACLFPQLDSHDTSFNPYNASGVSQHDASFEDNDLLLSCTGFILDSISGLSARGKGYFEWCKSSIVQPHAWKSVYGSYKKTSEALGRTLVMDRVEDGKLASRHHSTILNLPSTFEKARSQFESRGWAWLAAQERYYFRWEGFRVTNKDFQLGDYLLDEYFTNKIPDEESEEDMTAVYSAVDRSCKKRRFMTTTNGYMGWAPDNIYGTEYQQTRLGDLIAIIFGCSTPIVVRPMASHFQVLGEAYVQGLMDGAAIELLESGRFQTQRFTFC